MRRLMKWLFIGLGSLVGLLVAAVVVVVFVVDPNSFRGEIEDRVEQQTGRELTIQGDLELGFFPWFRIEMGKTRLAEAEGFGDEPFVTSDRVELAVKVLPLLTGDLQLSNVVLERPSIRLIRNAQGEANWQQFPATEAPKGDKPASEGDGEMPAIVRNLKLAGVRVKEASVVYDDRQAGQRMTLDPLNLQLSDIRFGNDIPIQGDWRVAMGDGPDVTGELNATANVAPDLTSASVKGLELDLTASGEAIPAGEQTVSLDAGVEADLAAMAFDVSDIALEAAGARLTGRAKASVAGEPEASGRFELAEVSPREVMGNLAMPVPETRDGDVLRSFSGSVEFAYQGGGIRLEPFQLKLDDSQFDGWVHLRDPARPAVDFDLQLDRINVDRYLPPPSEEEPKQAEDEPKEEKGSSEEARIPAEPLRPLLIEEGKVRIGALTVSGADLEDVTLNVSAENGLIEVTPINAGLYGGQYKGNMTLDARPQVGGDRVKLTVNERLNGIQAEPLLSDLAGFSRLAGLGNISLDATTTGSTVTELLDGLKGKSEFSFSDGTFAGINLAQTIRQGMARLEGQKLNADAAQETDFTTLGGTVKIDGGTLSNDDLNLKTPLLRVQGGGKVNAITREIDYNLNLNVVDSLQGQDGPSLQKLKGVPIPLRISGSLMNPSFDLALGQAMEAAARQKVEAKKDEAKEKVEAKKKEVESEAKKKVKDKASEKLKDLFN